MGGATVQGRDAIFMNFCIYRAAQRCILYLYIYTQQQRRENEYNARSNSSLAPSNQEETLRLLALNLAISNASVGIAQTR
jgi:hypothetical protein